MNLEEKNRIEIEDFIINLYNRGYVEALVINIDNGIEDCTILGVGLPEKDLHKAKLYNLPIVYYNPYI